ncbi:MAG: PSD1 and planctomycete cytochrome C domain-containing protein [Capsulimonadales bacterium]|nr:PSD1 and planctomycete cytochrome C domain-containing protein [Capsulimonadales bacterium]
MTAGLLAVFSLLIGIGATAQPPTGKRVTKAAPKPPPRASDALFTREVLPILKSSCLPCHSGSNPSGGLNLADRAALLKGGYSGPAVIPGKPDSSPLIRAVRFQGRQMPPQGKLPQSRIDVLTRWVAEGAVWPADNRPIAATSVHQGPPPVNAETRRFWSFRPVKRPVPPKVRSVDRVRNPIDAFILARLEKSGLKPARPASRATLIRRAYFDLIGLPPTPDEVRAFVQDTSPRAWETVVDRLLASPQYGERWGRHWLDLVRYAETNSFERDADKPFVWRYRDYVIRSFHQDKPYNRFLLEQLAGDELPDATPETLIATGYLRLGIWDDEAVDHEQAIYDDLDDILSTTGQTMLGLTVGCARCHDHKIDPMPQRDYYRMLAFFRNVPRYGNRGYESVQSQSLRPISSREEQERHAAETKVYREKLAELNEQIKAIEKLVRPTFSNVEKEDFENEQNRPLIVRLRVPQTISQAQYEEYVARTAARRDLLAHPPRGLEMALCVTETGPEPKKTFVLARGNAHSPGEEVAPGFLSVVTDEKPIFPVLPPDAKTTGRRTALARWIASDRNPLTARVMANRVWQYHFGRGIVRSSSNFGFLGTPPTHPELLDYLASELVRGGWRLKPLHRQIMLSNAYRMSSAPDAVALKKDPENDLMWRFDMRRLEAEEIRDAMLAANGSLNPAMYGPSIKIKLPREVLLGQSVPGQGWDLSSPEEQNRRSVYIKVKRSLSVPILARYDVPDTDSTCPVRFATTQPTQALGMMNSEFVGEQARTLADFTRKVIGGDVSLEPRQVRFVLERVLQREPTAKEVQRGLRLLTDLRRKDRHSPEAALDAFCLLAYNLNEFIYLD